DFQDSPVDEEDTRSSHEYLNDLEEEYQERALLDNSKRFFKKGTQSSPQHKPELRPTKYFEAKYNKVKAKLALLSSSASTSKVSMIKNKGLIVEAYKWDEEEVSSDVNEIVEVKVLMALVEENDIISKEGTRISEWVKISMRKVHILLEIEDNDDREKVLFCQIMILVVYSQLSHKETQLIIKLLSPTIYDLADKSSVCSTPLLPLKKLDGAELTSGPKTIKSILRSISTFKAEALKGVIINEPSSAPAKGNKHSSASKVHSAPFGKLMSVKIKDDSPLAIDNRDSLRNTNNVKDSELASLLDNSKRFFKKGTQRFSSAKVTDQTECHKCGKKGHFDEEEVSSDVNEIVEVKVLMALVEENDIKRILGVDQLTEDPSSSGQKDIVFVKSLADDTKVTILDKSSVCSTPLLPLKKLDGAELTSGPKTIKSILRSISTFKAEALKGVIINEPSSAPAKGNKHSSASKVHSAPFAFVNSLKYNLISISQLCDAKYIVQFDKKRGTIFNSNKEVVMIAPRVRDVYVLDMTSSAQESCFFAKASKNLNWL
nr:putative ribonuclease H-like domain-containing protein [Tanacetum cinerariifolium]